MTFVDDDDDSEECLMCGKGRNQRWLPFARSRYEIMYISASIHNRNEIPMAM